MQKPAKCVLFPLSKTLKFEYLILKFTKTFARGAVFSRIAPKQISRKVRMPLCYSNNVVIDESCVSIIKFHQIALMFANIFNKIEQINNNGLQIQC